MARTLTKKRRGFVKDYLETGNGTLAVMENFDVVKPKTASIMASELLDDPKVQKAIQDAIPDELLAEKHLALLRKMNGDDIDVNSVRSGLDMAYKLKGSYAPEKSVSTNLNITAELEPEEQSQLLSLLNDQSRTS